MEDKKEREREVLSYRLEREWSKNVSERDRAKAEGKTDTTVDNFLIFLEGEGEKTVILFPLNKHGQIRISQFLYPEINNKCS